MTVSEVCYQFDRVFAHNVPPKYIFQELMPWLQSLVDRAMQFVDNLAKKSPKERQYDVQSVRTAHRQTLAFIAYGNSGLGKTRILTGDTFKAAAGVAQQEMQKVLFNRSVIYYTLDFLLKNKPPNSVLVGRCIDIYMNLVYDGASRDKNKKGKPLGSAFHSPSFRTTLDAYELADHNAYSTFIKTCVDRRHVAETPRNKSGSSRSHQVILLDILQRIKDEDPIILGSVVFGDLAGMEGKEVEGEASKNTSSINTELGYVVQDFFQLLASGASKGKSVGTMCRNGKLAPFLSRLRAECDSRWVVLGVVGKDRKALQNATTLKNMTQVCSQLYHPKSFLFVCANHFSQGGPWRKRKAKTNRKAKGKAKGK
jgi:hypothetical protein